MSYSLLSVYKKTSIIQHKKQFFLYTAIISFVFCLIFFVWLIQKVITSSIPTMDISHFKSTQKQVVFPSKSDEKNVSELYSVTPLIDTKDPFRVRDPIDDDDLLLTAPRAKSKDTLVGVLTSSNPEKNIAIIESGGKQLSYGLHDRIAGKLTILKIFHDRVVINENGSYANFILEE
jgi:general secretion pathway protein C